MTKRSIILLIAILALVLAAAGCGGGGDSSSSSGSGGATSASGGESASGTTSTDEANSTSSSSLSEAQFLKQANKICTDGEIQVAKDLETYLKEQSLNSEVNSNEALVAGAQSVLLPGIQSEIDELREIGLPRGSEKQVEAILSAMQEAVYAAQEHNNETPHGLGPLFEHAGALAREYGIHGCGFA